MRAYEQCLRGASTWLLIAAAAVVAPSARAEVEVIDAPIVDGRRAGVNDVHATVALVDAETGESNCTGTLVAPRVVVTAAHCLASEDEQTGQVTAFARPEELIIVAGALDVREASSAQSYAVASVIVHEGYPNESPPVDVESGAGRYDDIAILTLARAVDGLRSAAIPSVDEALGVLNRGTPVTVSGYGATSPDTDDSGVLYIAELEFALRAEAELVLGGAGQPDTCPGDSGGPAYLLGEGRALLIGATSRASESAEASCGDGGVYSFVPFYRSWIADRSGGLYIVDGNDDPGPIDEPEELDNPIDEPDFDDGSSEDCAGGGASSSAAALLLAGVWLCRRRARST